MASITTIQGSDIIKNSRTDINNNFTNLNNDKIETSYLDTDTTLSANSDTKIPTQKAVKAYVDTGGNVNASETTKGIVEEGTLAEVIARTATGATGAKLFVTPDKLPPFFVSTQVFSGNPPSSYTDLDLSSVVGTQTRLVFLRIQYNSNNCTIFTKTDSSGVVEWITTDGGNVMFRENGATTTMVNDGASGFDFGSLSGMLSGTVTVTVLVYL